MAVQAHLRAPRTPRIEPVAQPTPEEGELLAATLLRPDAQPPNLFRTLLRHPTLMKRTNVLGGMFLTRGRLAARDRELAILRVAARTGCGYEYRQHRRLALACGLSETDVRATAEPDLSGLDAADRDLLYFVDSVADEADVPDELWQPVAAAYGDDQLLELILLVGFYRMLAGLLNAVGVPLDQDVAGAG
jgi:4-carboxymuconolactone decarboxylase